MISNCVSDDELNWAADRGYWHAVQGALTGFQYRSPDASRTPLLHLLVEMAPVEMVQKYLATEPDINARNEQGVTALALAADSRDAAMIRLLVSHGAKIEKPPDARGFTDPLCRVVGRPPYDPVDDLAAIIRELVSAGADPNSGHSSADCILTLLICSGNTDAAEALIQCGATIEGTAAITGVSDVVQALVTTSTPLMDAACRGDAAMVALLLRYGANPNAVTPGGRSPLQEAMRHGHSIVQALLHDAGAVRPDAVDSDIHSAILWHELETVLALVRQGADLEVRNTAGRTPLMQAAACLPELVLVLIGHGADVHAIRGEDPAPDSAASAYRSPNTDALSIAISCGNTTAVRQLIDAGANPNTNYRPVGDAWTPLMVAASSDRADIAELLIERGAQIDARTRSGDTPLLIAARRGRSAVFAVLVGHGADVNAINRQGRSAATMAADYWYTSRFRGQHLDYSQTRPIATDMLGILQKAGVFTDALRHNSLAAAIHSGDIDAVRLHLSQGADPNQISDGKPVIHAAISGGHADIVSLLLNAGARLVLADAYDYKTVLEHAINSGSTETIRLLIDHGADPNAMSPNGLATMIVTAIESGYPAAVRALIAAGASIPEFPEQTTGYGRYALLHAIEQHNVFVVRAIVEAGCNLNQLLITAAEGRSPDVVHYLIEQGALQLPYHSSSNQLVDDLSTKPRYSTLFPDVLLKVTSA